MKKIKYFLFSIFVVVVITEVISPKFMDPPPSSSGIARNDIRYLCLLLKRFKFENSIYPESIEGLAFTDLEKRKYKEKKWPIDSWGNFYIYKNPGKHGDIDIYSLGPDGIPSQDDIGIWQIKDEDCTPDW